MNILLTGKPRVGKTTIIKKILESFEEWTGFYTEEIMEMGRRVGFEIVTPTERKILSHVGFKTPYFVSKYKVDVEALEHVVSKIDLKANLIVIDEIGKMELFSEKFQDFVLMALNTQKVLGTVTLTKIPIVENIKKRRDTKVIEVKVENRNKLVQEILGLLKK